MERYPPAALPPSGGPDSPGSDLDSSSGSDTRYLFLSCFTFFLFYKKKKKQKEKEGLLSGPQRPDKDVTPPLRSPPRGGEAGL